MQGYIGDFAEDSTVYLYYGTYDGGTGASIVQSGFAAADVKIYKDGGLTQMASADGVTIDDAFDAIVGIHKVEIDTSNDTGHAGFWVAQADYVVIIDVITIDAQSVSFVLGSFSIENRVTDLVRIQGGVVPVPTTTGVPDVNVERIDDDRDAAIQIRHNLDTTLRFVVHNAFTPTTTQVQPDAVFFGDTAGTLEETDNHYKDKTIIGLTGANKDIAKLITGYDGTNKRFTFYAMPEAFANDDQFIVI